MHCIQGTGFHCLLLSLSVCECSSRYSVISVTLGFGSWTCGLPGSRRGGAHCSSPTASTRWQLSRSENYTPNAVIRGQETVFTVIRILVCLQEGLDELAAWLDAHPKEVLIVSCSHFDSLTDGDHACLVENILTLFGDKLCSSKVTWFTETICNNSFIIPVTNPNTSAVCQIWQFDVFLRIVCYNYVLDCCSGKNTLKRPLWALGTFDWYLNWLIG